MRDQLEQRLKQLKAEFEAGQKMLAELEAKQANVRETLLRISGAIQVLEEELTKAEAEHKTTLEGNGKVIKDS
jgi:chromosome segregation ATPase